MNDNGWNDVDQIVFCFKAIILTALMSVVLVVVLIIYEVGITDESRQNQPSISQLQAQAMVEYTRDVFFMKCEE